MTLEDIVAIDGIVIRRIPYNSVSLFAYRNKNILPDDELVFHGESTMIRRTTKNSLGGKYIVTKQMSQMSKVTFNIKRDGVGDTVVEAYQDMQKKTEGEE